MAHAQSLPGARPLVPGDFITERTAGFSWYSPGGSFGDVTDRRVYLTGLRATWVQGIGGPLAIAYTAELIPLAIVERTRPNHMSCWLGGTGDSLCIRDQSARVAVGAGATPLGARLYFNRAGGWRVFAAGGGGMLFFTSDVPIHESRRMNFVIEYGGGVEIPTRGRAFTVGYKFHHISNAGMGRFNPGLDANVLYFGLNKRRPRA